MEDNSTHKKCSGCKQPKLKEEYYKNKSKKDGLQSSCKSCAYEYQWQWRNEARKTQSVLGFIKTMGKKND
tara:strand:+ start:562 stop:771 length:210 start_codon:yes stop_codon:yes gene_type:complete